MEPSLQPTQKTFTGPKNRAKPVRAFEDFHEGEEFESRVVTIEAEQIRRFAELSGDHNPIHMDPEFARRTHFRGVVAHGMLVASMVTGLAYEAGLFGENTLALENSQEEYLMPARPGDRFFVQGRVLSMEPDVSKRCGRIRWEMEAYRVVDGGGKELIMRAAWSTLIFKAPYLKRLRKS